MNAALRPDGTGHRDPMGDDAPASAALRERAAAVGVATDYTSFWGEPVQVPPGVLQRTLAAMGDATEVRSRTHVLAQGQGATLPAGGPWPCASTWVRDRTSVASPMAAKVRCSTPGGT